MTSASSGVLTDRELTGKSYQCIWCPELFYKSEVWILGEDPSLDWQGDLDFGCRVCFDDHYNPDPPYTVKNWRKACKARWNERAEKSGEHLKKRVRTIGWKQAVADVGKRPEGVSRKEHRKTVIQASVQIVTALTIGFQKLKLEQKFKCMVALDEWDEEWEKKTADPEYIPELDSKFKIQDFEAQFLSELVPGTDEFFLCRQRSCLYVGLNTDWVTNKRRSQYSCPMCGEQHRPWREQPGYVKSNKVFLVEKATKAQMMHVMGTDAPSILSATAGATQRSRPMGDHYVFPIVWTETATSALQNKFKSITGELDEKLAHIAEPRARMEYVLQSLSEKPPHSLFKKMEMSDVVVSNLEDKNRKAGDPGRQWDYQPLLKSGFWGMHCKMHEEAFDQPLGQEDIIRIWGLTKWFLHQSKVSSKL